MYRLPHTQIQLFVPGDCDECEKHFIPYRCQACEVTWVGCIHEKLCWECEEVAGSYRKLITNNPEVI